MEILFGIGVVGAVCGIAILSSRHAQKRRQIWAQVAADRGGTYAAPKGLLGRGKERLDVKTRHGSICIDWFSRSTGNSTVHYTRVRSNFARGIGPKFRVYKENVFSSLGKAMGTQDVVLGIDQVFDTLFMVKCDDDPAVLRRLWTPESQKLMRQKFPKARVMSDGFTVELIEVGLWKDPAKLHAALDLFTLFVDRDIYGIEGLTSLSGSSRLSPEGVPQAELAAPARVVISAEPVKEQLLTVARLQADPGIDPMVLVIGESGRPGNEDLASKLPQGAHVCFGRVGGGRLIIEPGATRFEFARIENDPDRLRASAELLGALSAGAAGDGVYR